MKTTEQLQKEIQQDLIDKDINAKSLSIYYLKYTGNLVNDFYSFTHGQGGGLSRNLTDPYLKYGGHWPPKPHTDGNYYHTAGDVTWDTAQFYCPKITCAEFYSMGSGGYQVRIKIVNGVLARANQTQSPAVNALLGYCMWASGNYNAEIRTYTGWYNSNIRKDISELGDKAVFIRLIDIRKWTLRQKSEEKNNPGWIKGLLSFYKLFINYTK